MTDWKRIADTITAIAGVMEGVAGITRWTRVAVEEVVRTADIVLDFLHRRGLIEGGAREIRRPPHAHQH
ncbi:hypothetical protein VKT23_019436 [Stygiomarasmius scandens]|uniref:Uncharacterized protein n=1 Tax=Marasmiellus scandens TaxID=2682957 RepID=A0ABR1IQX2_9AGAR